MISFKKYAPLLFCALLAACASSASPEDAEMANALCEQGKSLLKTGHNSSALDVYRSATTRDEDNSHAWNGVGVSNDLLGNRSEAKNAYQKALDLNPNDLSVVNNLAHLYLESGQPDKAIALLEPHAEDPNAPETLRQNLALARKAAVPAENKPYAELGSYPTEGMAQGRVAEVKSLLDDNKVVLEIVPEVRTGGGIPTFTLEATGRSPQSICKVMNAQAFPCIPHGK